MTTPTKAEALAALTDIERDPDGYFAIYAYIAASIDPQDPEPVTRERLARVIEAAFDSTSIEQAPDFLRADARILADAILAAFPALGAAPLTNAEPGAVIARLEVGDQIIGRWVPCIDEAVAMNEDGDIIGVCSWWLRETFMPPPTPAAFDPRVDPLTEEEGGLYDKFRVERTDGQSAPGRKHDGCEYFVLDLTHDKFAWPALRMYAARCGVEYPALSADLFDKINAHDVAQIDQMERDGKVPHFSDPERR